MAPNTSYNLRWQPVILTVMAVQVALIAVLFHFKGEADIGSFAVAKLTFLFMPETFPQNNTADANRWRKLLGATAVSFQPEVGVHSEDVYIGAAGGDEAKWVRIYNADKVGKVVSAPRQVLVFAFPGAWILGSVDSLHVTCMTLAKHTNFVVVSVNYRQAPEHPFPAAFNDYYDALLWVSKNIHAYGGNPDQIFLSGESAGGNLAAAAAARNLDVSHVRVEDRVSVRGLLLVYPPLAANFTSESYVKYARYNGILTTAEMKHAWAMYAGGQSIPEDDYTYQPMMASDAILSAFPRTELITAEFDVLRDDSYHFASRLRRVGGKVNVINYPSTIHGFWGRDMTPVGQEALIAAGDKLLEMAFAV